MPLVNRTATETFTTDGSTYSFTLSKTPISIDSIIAEGSDDNGYRDASITGEVAYDSVWSLKIKAQWNAPYPVRTIAKVHFNCIYEQDGIAHTIEKTSMITTLQNARYAQVYYHAAEQQMTVQNVSGTMTLTKIDDFSFYTNVYESTVTLPYFVYTLDNFTITVRYTYQEYVDAVQKPTNLEYWEDGDEYDHQITSGSRGFGIMTSNTRAQIFIRNPKKIDHLTEKSFDVTEFKINMRGYNKYLGASGYASSGTNLLAYVDSSQNGFVGDGTFIRIVLYKSNGLGVQSNSIINGLDRSSIKLTFK